MSLLHLREPEKATIGGSKKSSRRPILWSPDLFVVMADMDTDWLRAFRIECPQCGAPVEVACKSSRTDKDNRPFMHHRPHGERVEAAKEQRKAYAATVRAATTPDPYKPREPLTARRSAPRPRVDPEHRRDLDGQYEGRYGLWHGDDEDLSGGVR